jgi:hypothetical protein
MSCDCTWGKELWSMSAELPSANCCDRRMNVQPAAWDLITDENPGINTLDIRNWEKSTKKFLKILISDFLVDFLSYS